MLTGMGYHHPDAAQEGPHGDQRERLFRLAGRVLTDTAAPPRS